MEKNNSQPLKESSAYVLQDCVPRGEAGLAGHLRNYFIKTFSHRFCLKLLAISSTEFSYDAGLPQQINIGLCMTYYLQVLSVLKVNDKVEQIIAYHQQQLGDMGPNQLILEEVKRLGKKKLLGKLQRKNHSQRKVLCEYITESTVVFLGTGTRSILR